MYKEEAPTFCLFLPLVRVTRDSGSYHPRCIAYPCIPTFEYRSCLFCLIHSISFLFFRGLLLLRAQDKVYTSYGLWILCHLCFYSFLFFFSILFQWNTERLDTESHRARWDSVRRDIHLTGTYDLTETELTFGAKLAWRNSARCIGRIQWAKLQVCLIWCSSFPITLARFLVVSLASPRRFVK